MRVSLAFAALLLAAGCEDIRQFQGTWTGTVAADPTLRQGFAADAPLRATIVAVSRTTLQMTVVLPDNPDPTAFEPIRRAAADALGDLRLEGEPLRTFLGYLRSPGAEPLLTVVSLFSEERVDVRLIRGPDDVYGLFALKRAR
jgi:hypothetical protein